ncbi:alkyl hydroperoxide reductase [Pseudoxanthomonas broegbernensis]|uniref:Alkyl hydroperoxide reductase n=1 Tax=Pseudoxanthomonas broegbernensis TaxID=83619 RepID=A0A7V8GNE6_9GAMM|nr:alkyl hydroperoxide reductase [Pseudoxanthomonas broegbernensis]
MRACAALLVSLTTLAAVAAAGELRLPDLDGKTRSLSQWRGQPVLINYWATWCGPCIKEMPELDAFAGTQSRAGGVQVVGIALDEASSVKAYLARKPVRYPVLVEAVEYGDSGSSARYGNAHGVLPYSVLLDAQGRVVRSKAGPLTAAELAAWQGALHR